MFHGSIVALVTPMLEDGSIDYESLSKLVDFHLNSETDGLVVLGTTGESSLLEPKEKHEIVKKVIKQVANKIPVIVGTGDNSTKKTAALTLEAEQLGADACLLMTPAYIKPTQEGLYNHFKEIAGEVAIPLIAYNVPGRTAVDLLPETIARLAEIPSIIGIKEATGDPDRAESIISLCGDKIDIYSGDDAIAKDIILNGGKGCISVTANVAPQAMHNLCMYSLAGEADKATAIDDKIKHLHKNLFVETNPIPVKWALARMNLIKKGIRMPLTWLDDQYHLAVEDAMNKAGVTID